MGNLYEEVRNHLAQFWGLHVTGFNPEPYTAARPHEEAPMMQIVGTELENNAITLSQLVNRVQRHICTDTYCQRLNKKTGQKECRFYFPDEHRDEAEIKQHPERSWLQYYPPRNDGWVNKYNRLLSLAWQANTDVSPCTSMTAVIEYIRLLQSHRIGSPYTKRAGKDRVLNIFPRYRLDEVEDYGRVKLMLHHPFRDVNDLKHIPGIHDHPCATFADAWAIADELCEYPPEDRDGLDESLPEPEPSVHEGTPDDADGDDADSVEEDWELLARQLPARDGTGVNTSEQLGKRAFDLQYAWDDKIGTHPDLTADWWKLTKADNPVDFRVDGAMVTNYEDLEVKQKQLYDLVVDHYTDTLDLALDQQLLVHVDGEGGTGKTTVVLTMCHRLEQIASERGLPSPVCRGAPTGVAAHNILGKTMHSLFRLPVKKDDYVALSAQARKILQEAWKHVKYLILDEKSMVSLKLFSWIDRRCREIWPTRQDVPFGGLNLVLVGDYCQLPPVGGKALYNDNTKGVSIDVLNGQRMYLKFNRTITLTQVMRQQGNDAEAVAFRTALGNLRTNRVTAKDWQLLTTRVQAKVMIKEDISAWKDALHLYQTRDLVNEYNHSRMRDLANPKTNEGAVIVFEADHSGPRAKDASTDNAEGLKRFLPVAIGSRVMLQENVWTE
jgi:ATP-dependent DNA helicase PIF1